MTRLVALLATTALLASHVHAFHVQPEVIADALLFRVRVGKTFVAHCRHAREGCPRRMHQVALHIVEAAQTYGVDPYLLAAIAIRESGLNPDARGELGELGLMQLHPYSRVGIRARWICKRAPSDCTRAVVMGAAEYLKQSLIVCGSTKSGLTAYNSGRCGESDYAARVMRERERLAP